jgi:hypothetical protein
MLHRILFFALLISSVVSAQTVKQTTYTNDAGFIEMIASSIN